MSKSNVVFCVEWGVSPMAYSGKCFPRLKTFASAYDARYFFDGIDLKSIFEVCIEDRPSRARSITAKKICYVGERDVYEQIVPLAFLDRADYAYDDFAIDSLKRSELQW